MKAHRLRLWFFLFATLLPFAAHAQQEPLMGSEASVDAVAPVVATSDGFGGADGIYRILVVGDSLAGGLGAGMARMVQDDPRYEIVNRFNESSGLSRSEVYDWPNAIGKIVTDKPVDAVVVLLGVNDRQDIRRENFRYPFKSPDWLTGYQGNVDRLLASIKTANAVPVWVSIPPMADPTFDADMRFISDIHARQVAARAGTFFDVRRNFLAADGSYTDRGPDDTGTDRKLRSRDGVGFFKQGNNRFGQLVMAEITRLAAAPALVSSNVATAETTIPAPPQTDVTIVTALPSFGQEGLDGEQLTFRADAIQPKAPGPISMARRTATGVAIPEARLTAKSGSQAQRLFNDGIVGDAPAGRFDDYAVPVTP